jgi:hypothetical protein
MQLELTLGYPQQKVSAEPSEQIEAFTFRLARDHIERSGSLRCG